MRCPGQVVLGASETTPVNDSMTTTFLSEDEARHRAILEAALDCVVTIDHEGRVLEFNPAAERTFGYRRSEVLGRRIGDLIVPHRLRAEHLDGLERFVATGEGRILGERIELPALRSDGREIVVEIAVTRVELPGLPVFTAYIRDISERKRADEELHRSQELYRLVVENSKDLVGLVGLDGEVVFASPSHREKLGYEPEALVGRSLEAIVHPDDVGALRSSFAMALEAARGPFEGVRLQHADGRWVSVDGAASAIPAEDTGARLLLLTAHDVSGRLEDERTRERREQAERDFVTNAAHDLRTPLAAIAAAVEVLQSGAKEIPGERDAFLADVERETARLGRLTRALLELARVQAAGEEIATAPVELAPLLTEIAASLKTRDGVEVVVECALDLTVLAEPGLLERAVTNLALNAVEHTSRGTIALVGRCVVGREVEIEVRDSGRGIHADDHARVFDRFYRAGTRGPEGFGLGLAIVREAVRVLGGTVHLESVLGQGTTIRLTLPACGSGEPACGAREPDRGAGKS